MDWNLVWLILLCCPESKDQMISSEKKLPQLFRSYFGFPNDSPRVRLNEELGTLVADLLLHQVNYRDALILFAPRDGVPALKI
jgi:hypothetical protein